MEARVSRETDAGQKFSFAQMSAEEKSCFQNAFNRANKLSNFQLTCAEEGGNLVRAIWKDLRSAQDPNWTIISEKVEKLGNLIESIPFVKLEDLSAENRDAPLVDRLNPCIVRSILSEVYRELHLAFNQDAGSTLLPKYEEVFGKPVVEISNPSIESDLDPWIAETYGKLRGEWISLAAQKGISNALSEELDNTPLKGDSLPFGIMHLRQESTLLTTLLFRSLTAFPRLKNGLSTQNPELIKESLEMHPEYTEKGLPKNELEFLRQLFHLNRANFELADVVRRSRIP